MRTVLRGVSMVVVIVAGFSACLSGPPRVDTSQIPAFFLNPPSSNDTLYGVGDAKMATLSLSRSTAIARARDDIAGQVSVSVKNALTDYAQQAGEGGNQQTVQFVETVSRQVADVTLSGCRTEQVEVADDGSVYVLVSYDVKSVLDAAQTEFTRNEAAAFAEFKADEALRRLNDEIQK